MEQNTRAMDLTLSAAYKLSYEPRQVSMGGDTCGCVGLTKIATCFDLITCACSAMSVNNLKLFNAFLLTQTKSLVLQKNLAF